MKSKCLVILMLAVLTGCAPAAISPSIQQQAGPPISFAALSANPEQYQGRLVILAGEVMTLEPLGKGSLMTVDQRDRDKLFALKNVVSGGTFLVESDQWLSPSTFQPKSKIEVAGVVLGRKNGQLALKAREVVLKAAPGWEQQFYPIPPWWYDYDPAMEYWYTPPYWDPNRPRGRW